MRHLFTGLFIMGLTLTFSNVVRSVEFTVGVEELNYYPLYAQKDGQYAGLAREILDKFAQSKGHVFKYKPFPVIRLTKTYLGSDSLDFKFPDNPHWASKDKEGKGVNYSDAVLDYTDGVMVLPANLDKGIDQMKKLGIVRGFTPWDWLSLVKSGQVALKETSSLDALIQQTIHERVNGAYFNVQVANYHLEHNLKTKGALAFDNSLPHTSDFYYLSSRKHADIIKQFNQFLIDEAAWISSLKTKYGLK